MYGVLIYLVYMLLGVFVYGVLIYLVYMLLGDFVYGVLIYLGITPLLCKNPFE